MKISKPVSSNIHQMALCKCIESEKEHHSKKPTFYDKQLRLHTYRRYFHSKDPEKALCLFPAKAPIRNIAIFYFLLRLKKTKCILRA